MSRPLDLKNPDRLIHIGVILPDDVNELLDVAPIDVFHTLSKENARTFPDELLPPSLKAQAIDLQLHWVSPTGKAPSRLTAGLTVVPTDSYDTCPPLDIVLMGAQTVGYQPTAADLAFVRKSFAGCAAFLTICAGMSAPLLAGVLQGRKATAPRFMLETLRAESPGVEWLEKRWVRDDGGKVWTSGVLLNGLELVRAFVEHNWGGEGSLVQALMAGGSWPNRDVDYKDGP
ncbi:hypothetical protein SLS62_003715 [Diatrype stigma]|uniref:DJ-1/PfpI domain-containing protein n=1 Tax=Diatrype stigma TaxID=117547 RepID=A0AAN9UUW4_9PEZI